ncbi:MAG: GntR family transcriptional regulator [Oscillospiraceae bacterium]|nr:GntR family transcriptional regulator [Oscillospiraceae bacterium]
MIKPEREWQLPFSGKGFPEKLVWITDSSAAIPKYQRLQKDIVLNIKRKVFLPGERIPPESWYRKAYGVSAITVRGAFSALIEDDVLYAEQGRGTFVKRRTLRWKTVSSNFADNVEESWYTPSTRILDVRSVVEPEVAKLMELPPPEPITEVKRLRYMNDEPAAVSISYLPTSIFTSDDRVFLELQRSLYKVLASKGIKPYSTKETFSFGVISKKEIYTLLQYGRNAPIIYGQRFNYDAEKKLFEYTRNYLRSDMYQIICYHQRIN